MTTPAYRHMIHQLAWMLFGFVGFACGANGDRPMRSVIGVGLVLAFMGLFVIAVWTEPRPTDENAKAGES